MQKSWVGHARNVYILGHRYMSRFTEVIGTLLFPIPFAHTAWLLEVIFNMLPMDTGPPQKTCLEDVKRDNTNARYLKENSDTDKWWLSSRWKVKCAKLHGCVMTQRQLLRVKYRVRASTEVPLLAALFHIFLLYWFTCCSTYCGFCWLGSRSRFLRTCMCDKSQMDGEGKKTRSELGNLVIEISKI